VAIGPLSQSSNFEEEKILLAMLGIKLLFLAVHPIAG
jgi:hypothetical protein